MRQLLNMNSGWSFLKDTKEIPIDDILDIEGEIFDNRFEHQPTVDIYE